MCLKEIIQLLGLKVKSLPTTCTRPAKLQAFQMPDVKVSATMARLGVIRQEEGGICEQLINVGMADLQLSQIIKASGRDVGARQKLTAERLSADASVFGISAEAVLRLGGKASGAATSV